MYYIASYLYYYVGKGLKLSKKINLFICFVVLIAFMMPCLPVYAADTKVDFEFSRNVVTFKKGTNSNIAQTPMITVKNLADPEKVKGYSITYKRTHGGDGSKLRTAEKATAAPSLAGTYTAIITFESDVPFVCKNGSKTQEYPSAFVIKRAEQAPPVLRSASAALTDNEDKTGGSMKVGSSAIISIAWSSGLKPILTWTSGSEQMITAESGKPARFTAKASGTAVLTAVLPEDNNYLASSPATYIVKVGGASTANSMYDIIGESKMQNDWYTSDVTISGKNGFTTVVSAMAHPITSDGITDFKFSLENESGGVTSELNVTVKKDSAAPVIDNFTVNDSPWINPPEDETSAWAASADLVLKLDVTDSASGIAKVEYRLDGGNYINDTNSAFEKEGCTHHEFSITIDNGGHMLWVRATDTAGNVGVQEFLLPKGGEETAQSQSNSQSTDESQVSSSESTGVSQSQEAKITEPTESMNAVTARLDYLRRCHIEAAVRGDVRANQDYINTTLEMFSALTSAEREALGDETLTALRQYFEMLYTVQGKDTAELAALFIFEKPKPPESQSPSSSQSTVSSSSSATSFSSSSLAPNSQSIESSFSQASSAVSSNNDNTFNFTYLIPVVVFIAAIAGYFIYQRSLVKKPKFKLPDETDAEKQFSEFGGFDDLDE